VRLVLQGAGSLASAVFDGVLAQGHVVVSVVAPAGDRLLADAAARGVACHASGGCLAPAAIPDATDLIVNAGGRAYIPARARERARHGAIGFHPSLLPRHRGRDAIKWTLYLRDAVTGGTVYWMDERIDGGPIAAQAWCHVRPDDDPRSLWVRDLRPIGVALLLQVIGDVERGVIARVEQDDALATWEPPFGAASL